jgi:hypothetical protein
MVDSFKEDLTRRYGGKRRGLKKFLTRRRRARGGEEKVFVRERGVKLTSAASI